MSATSKFDRRCAHAVSLLCTQKIDQFGLLVHVLVHGNCALVSDVTQRSCTKKAASSAAFFGCTS